MAFTLNWCRISRFGVAHRMLFTGVPRERDGGRGSVPTPVARRSARKDVRFVMIALKSILVATDFGEASGAALAYGRELARTFGATLHVLNVADDVYVRLGGDAYMAVLPELQRDLEIGAQKQLDELVIDNDPNPLPVKTAVLTSSATAGAIVQYARDLDIDLIVVGTHGRGAVAHLFMGSVAERVVRSAPCPVLTVRHPEHEFVMPDALATIAQA